MLMRIMHAPAADNTGHAANPGSAEGAACNDNLPRRPVQTRRRQVNPRGV